MTSLSERRSQLVSYERAATGMGRFFQGLAEELSQHDDLTPADGLLEASKMSELMSRAQTYASRLAKMSCAPNDPPDRNGHFDGCAAQKLPSGICIIEPTGEQRFYAVVEGLIVEIWEYADDGERENAAALASSFLSGFVAGCAAASFKGAGA